jgi:acetylornithine deacetylase
MTPFGPSGFIVNLPAICKRKYSLRTEYNNHKVLWKKHAFGYNQNVISTQEIQMSISIDQDYCLESLKNLIRINSINPELVPDGPGEVQIAEHIAGELEKLGLQPQVQELKPKRCNAVAVLKGSGGGRSLMFNGHMDTVGVEGMKEPFSAEIRDGKLYGRGAQDMKGSLAAMLAAFKALVDSRVHLKGDLVFAAVADEEHGSIGTEAISRSHKTDAAVVTEPSGLEIGLAHRGFDVFEITTRGFATHGSLYQDGIDANMHMGRILAELDRLSQSLLDGPKHPLVGPPSLHIPVIKGGQGLFIYSDKCSISVERRTLPDERHEDVINEMASILTKVRQEDETVDAALKEVMHRDGYEISREAEIVKILTETSSRVLHGEPVYTGHQWWEDSALLGEAGIETVIFGPKGAGAHSYEEWVDIQSVMDTAAILTETAIRFCG